MKKILVIIAIIMIAGCAGFNLEDTAGPPMPPVPIQVTSAERTAGTETELRMFAPADIASMAGTHGGGAVAGAFDFTTWNGDTNSGTKDAIRDQFYVYDTDGDGDIDNIDGAVGGGDITGVGPGGTGAGDALTDGYVTSGTTIFIWEGTTADANQVNFVMPEADPSTATTLTFPDQTGTFIIGAGAGYSDNVLIKADGATSHLTQATGVTVDDSNNMSGIGTISSGAITSTGTSTFGTAASPDAADGATLGSATAEWSDLFIADGGVIYGQSDQSNTLTSSATDWTFGLDVVITGSDLTLGAAGVKLTGDGDGAVTILGLGDGFDEDITINLDDTENTAVVSSSTGVTGITLSSIGITTGAASNLSGGTVTLGTVAGTITDGTASWNTSTQALAGFGNITGTGAVTGGTVTDGTVTLAGDGTITGITEGGLPNSIIVTADVKDNDLTTADLSATLTFSDGDLIDLSGITQTAATDEGLVIPTWANVAPTSDKKFLAADGSNLKLYNGGWVTIGASAAPTDAQYLTLALDATLSAERVLTEGTNGIDFVDGGANSTLTISFDATEVDAVTWSDGANASNVWTFDVSGTDHTMTAGDGVMTFGDAVTVTDTLTASAGTAVGASQSITGSTALTLGGGSETIAINSSDWDIDATGIATGMGNITSDGVVTATGFTIGSAAILEAELEILDGATTTTTQLNYINAATGTTGTTSTNLVFSASPTFTGTVVAAGIDGSGTFSANLFTPDAADGADIGSTSLEFSDIFIADGSIIYAGNDQDVTLTHVADTGFDLNESLGISDDKFITFGGSLSGRDWTVGYDETTSDALEFTHTAGAGADVTFDLNDNAADSTFTITNSDGTYAADLTVEGTITAASYLTSGSGDSYIQLSNNASIAGAGYQIFFEAGDLKSVENGTEKILLNDTDSATPTGTSWNFGSVTNFEISNGNSATADAEGEIAIDTDDDQFQLYVGGSAIVMDFTGDTNGYVLKSNGSGVFTLQADATAGSPTIDTVGDAAGDATITFDAGEEMSWQYTGNYTTGTQFLVQQQTGNPTGGVLFEARGADSDTVVFRAGDGTNIWSISTAGQLGNAGTATINFAAANDLLIGGGQIDHDDMLGTAAVTTQGGINLGTGGVVITDDGDGAITFTGAGDGSDEDLTMNLDDTANTVVFSSSTGVTELNLGSFNAVTTGVIMAGVNISSKTAATYTIGTDDTNESYGTVFVNGDNDAIDFTLPSAVGGMSVCIFQGQGVSGAITIQPNTGDYLVVDGTRGTAATDYTSSGAGGDKICVVAIDATDWIVTTEQGTWSE